jgi:hypothetical protein
MKLIKKMKAINLKFIEMGGFKIPKKFHKIYE